ncbi:MAG: RmuC family protein [marine bacterium B5-7]|nr:MAG: RmuC family protein [marine bacterium B5-7]
MPFMIILAVFAAAGLLFLLKHGRRQREVQAEQLNQQLQQALNTQLQSFREKFDEHQLNTLKTLQESLQNSLLFARRQITDTLDQNRTEIDKRLKEISGQVEKRLSEGFEKTTSVFSDVVKRLALIDEAQKKITELSGNVVSLQAVLSDKRSRGAFGEVQLNALIRNVMPENQFSLQHTLSNGRRVDCMLFLPEPTGNVAIDAKFPLESFQKLTDFTLPEADKKAAEQQFRVDIKKHIQDIADKYIISGETSEGAILFLPAEAVFAEIHAHYPDLVEYAQHAKVWLVSPTTMMAILTTASAVLKDEATRKQVHIIQEHLKYLSKDFERFEKRMDNLARHIGQANDDVADVHKSASKITSRFQKIEKVELDGPIAAVTPNLEAAGSDELV